MAMDKIDSALLADPTRTPAQPELLVSAVLHLMSHYTANVQEGGSCTKLASVIERHLKALADLPDLAPVLRDMQTTVGAMGDRGGTQHAATGTLQSARAAGCRCASRLKRMYISSSFDGSNFATIFSHPFIHLFISFRKQ